MNYNVLPKDKTEVVLKTQKDGHIFSAFFRDGVFYVIIDDDKTVSYEPREVECWHYSEDLFNGAKTQYTEPEKEPIDWEQRRYEIAKDVLSGSISNEGMHGSDMLPAIKSECFRAIQYAVALIELLKKGE
jgi:hypothetical protein